MKMYLIVSYTYTTVNIIRKIFFLRKLFYSARMQ